MKDEELILNAKKGDMEAFDSLHKRYRLRILNYTYRYIGNYQLAEEITQEVFMRVYRHLRDYEPRGQASSWIFRIATNLSKNALRDKRRLKEVSLDNTILFDEESPKFVDTIEDKKPGPDVLLYRKELNAKIQKVINELPLKYKEVLILCDISGVSYKESSEILNCSVQAIGVKLNRARMMMRELLKQRGVVK